MPSRTAPLRVPADVVAHLSRFNLTLPDLLTGAETPKMAKGADLGRAVILHHLPARALAYAIRPGHRGATAPRSYLNALAILAHREGLTDRASRWNGCPWATTGCEASCLNWAGHGGLSAAVASCRGRRTLAMIADPETYARAILWAIARQYAAALVDGVPLAVRLRGTDEGPAVGWHRLALTLTTAEAASIARRYGLPVQPGDGLTLPDILAPAGETIRLFDYSKAPLAGPLGLSAQRAAGWDVTASLAADRPTAAADALAALGAGFRLAVPVALVKGQALPATLTLSAPGRPPLTVPAIDGDASDHRWADPDGVAVILRTKISRGANPALADPFSLRPTGHPQALPDGVATLTW